MTPCSRVLRAALAAGVFAAAGTVAAFEPVQIDADGTLPALWQSAATAGAATGRRPVVLTLHGCGGLYNARGALDRRYTDYAARFNAAGWHVLATDSFSGRGLRSICTLPAGERPVTPAARAADVLRALQWLAARPDVDPARIALLGWSHGGMTVLETIDQRSWPGPVPVTAIAFYPGCNAVLRRGSFVPSVPLLILTGAADDWTPARYCSALQAQVRERLPLAPFDLVVYPDSYHGFDGTSALRFWPAVKTGVSKDGVHLGANPVAREAALARVHDTLDKALR